MALTVDENQDLAFDRMWNASEIDHWMRQLFPQPFKWLDARWGKPDEGVFHWLLLQKDQRRLFVLDRPKMTGEVLFSA